MTTNCLLIVYNRALFRQAGLDPDRPPRTPEEFDAYAAKLTAYDKNGRFIRYGFRPGGLEVAALVFGGGWFDPATDAITADRPENIAALTWMQGYAKRYDLKRMASFESAFGSLRSANFPFFVGKVAMWATGE